MLGELKPWFSGWLSMDGSRKEMDDLFDRIFREVGYRGNATPTPQWPAVESFFKDGNWVMRVDLPGVDPKNIDVAVAGDTLTIRASRERRSEEHKPEHDFSEVSYGRFERSASLPRGVNRDQIKASYQNGVLELTMPASPEWAGRRIPVEMGTDDTKRLEHQAA